MRKSFILWVFFALAYLAQAGAAKTYEFLLPTAAHAGEVTLAAGQYRLRVDGNRAIITNVRSKETHVVPVRVDSAEKHGPEAVDMKIAITKQAGVHVIRSIELEDTNTTLEF